MNRYKLYSGAQCSALMTMLPGARYDHLDLSSPYWCFYSHRNHVDWIDDNTFRALLMVATEEANGNFPPGSLAKLLEFTEKTKPDPRIRTEL